MMVIYNGDCADMGMADDVNGILCCGIFIECCAVVSWCDEAELIGD